MIRHSQSYLSGAISGTAVIAAAVVFFVLFVSAQALRDWPIGDLHLGGGNDSTAVSPAESLGAGGATNAAAANLSGPITGAPTNVAPGAKATAPATRGLRRTATGTARSPPRPGSKAAAGSTRRRSSNLQAPHQQPPRRRVGTAPRPPAREQLRRRPAAATAPPPGPARARARRRARGASEPKPRAG